MKKWSYKTVLFLSILLISTIVCSSTQQQAVGEKTEEPLEILYETPPIIPSPLTEIPTVIPTSRPTGIPVITTSGPSGLQPVDSVACPSLPSLPSIDTEGLPPLSVYLEDYIEWPDGGLWFMPLIINASEKTFESAMVMVQFYDQDGNPLTIKTETCFNSVIPGDSCTFFIVVEKEEIPANYATYNLYAESIADDGTRYEVQLSDHPLRGEEGIKEPVHPPSAVSHATWNLPPEGYTHGETLSIRFNVSLREGEVIGGALCGKVIEFRKDPSGQLFAMVLSETCQPVTVTQHAETLLDIPFTPSGYSWIEQESEAGAYTPMGILGCLTLDERSLDPFMTTLYLPPIHILGVWWEKDGTPVDTYKPGETLTSHIRITSLVSAEKPYKLSLKIMRYDAESRFLSWFTIIGGFVCATGICDDLFLQQDFDIQLVEGETTTYSLDVTFPAAGEEYYRILFFDDEPFWGEDDRIH